MELYQLRSFVAVAEVRHLTRAAEKLHISQPALSAQIKALEDELGVTLFERTSTGMVLSAAGERLLPAVEQVLSAAQALWNQARSLTGEITGHPAVGTLSDPAFIRLGEFLNATRARYPLLRLELHHEISGAAFEKVRDGELDAAFYYGALSHPAVAGLPLRPMTYRVAGPAAWREKVEQADWEEIAALPWILTPSISSHNRLVAELFGERGVAPTKVVEADQESVISSLVVSGVGLSLMREDVALAKRAAGEVCLWEKGRAATTLWFIYPQERADDPVIRALLDAIRATWGLRAEPAAPPARARSSKPAAER
jgi:DNA-binding transcriptional LysR family regulator